MILDTNYRVYCQLTNFHLSQIITFIDSYILNSLRLNHNRLNISQQQLLQNKLSLKKELCQFFSNQIDF